MKKDFIRNKIIKKIEEKEIDIQLIDYVETTVDYEYCVVIFGLTSEGKTISLIVKNVEVGFFINKPKNFSKTSIELLEDTLLQKYHDEMKNEKYYKDNLKNEEGKTKKVKIIDNNYKFKNIRLYHKEQNDYLKVVFKTKGNFTAFKRFIQKLHDDENPVFINNVDYTPRVYNGDIIPLYNFFHEKNIKSGGWIRLKLDKNTKLIKDERKRKTKSQIEYKLSNTDPIISLEKNEYGKISICSFDIECTSETGAFPLETNEKDYIIQIGMTYEKYNSKEEYNVIYTLDTCDEIKGSEVIECKTEEELLIKWAKGIEETNPDVLIGYNINGFDYKYIIERARRLGILNRILSLVSRFTNDEGKFKLCKQATKTLNSAGTGQNKYIYINSPGRLTFDICPYVRNFAGLKLDSYKLDHVAEYLLGLNKNDVSPQQIFKYQKIDSYHRKIVAEYCIQDCKLVNRITNKLCVIENIFAMASTCYVEPNSILMKGQTNKASSLISKMSRDYDYIIPYITPNREQESDISYTGAFVLDANSGGYYHPVSCLDFASLYPSCMISHNLCISSYIPKELRKTIPKEDKIIVDINIGFPDKKPDYHEYYKPKKPEELGVIPKIVQTLLKKRKETKKLMKKEKDPFKKNVLDGLQLAFKVTANSIYGTLGNKFSSVYFPEVAASITGTGRNLLMVAKYSAMKFYPGTEIVYGDTDSIFVKFKLKDHKEECFFHLKNTERRQKFYNKIKEKYKDNDLILNTEFKKLKECSCPSMNKEKKNKKKLLQKSIDISMDAENFITTNFLKSPHGQFEPHLLEYEKTYFPYILFTKKKYIGHKFEFDVNKHDLDYKGIALKRRNYCKWVKHIYHDIVEFLLEQKSKKEIFEYLNEELYKTINNKFDIKEFIMTKTLKNLSSYKVIKTKQYCNKGKMKTVEKISELQNDDDRKAAEGLDMIMLNEKIREIDEGAIYNTNERIPFCFIIPKEYVKKGSKAHHYVHSPKYIKELDYNINYERYIEKQLEKPVLELMKIINGEKEYYEIISKYLNIYYLKLQKTPSILDFYV